VCLCLCVCVYIYIIKQNKTKFLLNISLYQRKWRSVICNNPKNRREKTCSCNAICGRENHNYSSSKRSFVRCRSCSGFTISLSSLQHSLIVQQSHFRSDTHISIDFICDPHIALLLIIFLQNVFYSKSCHVHKRIYTFLDIIQLLVDSRGFFIRAYTYHLHLVNLASRFVK